MYVHAHARTHAHTHTYIHTNKLYKTVETKMILLGSTITEQQ